MSALNTSAAMIAFDILCHKLTKEKPARPDADGGRFMERGADESSVGYIQKISL